MFDEQGGDAVAPILASGVPLLMSAVNVAEAVGQLVRRHGVAPGAAKERVLAVGVEVVPFDVALAVEVGAPEAALRGRNISLADRACLMLARARGLPAAAAADRPWATLDMGVEVRLIR